jgi:hypothetical protein
VRVGLDDHQLVHLHRPVLADTAQVVAPSPPASGARRAPSILQQLVGLAAVLLLARPRGYGRRSARLDPASGDLDQRLGEAPAIWSPKSRKYM